MPTHIDRPLATLVIACAAVVPAVTAGPVPALHDALFQPIAAMQEGEWRQVNANTFEETWTPADQRPFFNVSGSNPTPFKLISAWSSYGWDTRRGDLIIYGGGHGNYSGNDVYRWRSSTLRWERIALPSEIASIPGVNGGWMTVDGPDASPGSAHTYDNNIYLPIVDRFVAFGGAIFNTGGVYAREDENSPGTYRTTGPYFLDPSRADGEKVGGLTGSHVQRVAPHPEIVGARLWSNRDIHKYLAGQALPKNHINGCTAYTEENGRDVVYISGGNARDLFRYEVGDLADPLTDRIDKVGQWYVGATNQMTCAYDPVARLFVKTGSNTKPFTFWDLNFASATHRDQAVEVNESVAAFVDWLDANGLNINKCAMDHDPMRGRYLVWCGGGKVWSLASPPDNAASGWSMTQLAPAVLPQPTTNLETGILGKWHYAPGYDVFVALQDSTQGNVWIYKPVGWQPSAWVRSPLVEIASPAPGTAVTPGTTVQITANASDPDGQIALLQVFVDGTLIGDGTSSLFTATWTPAATGGYTVTARAVDDAGNASVTSATHVRVQELPNVLPGIALAQPADGSVHAPGVAVDLVAAPVDSDGHVVRVEFLVDGAKVGEALSAPWSVSWTPAAEGVYEISAIAIDNREGVSTPASVTVVAGEEGSAGATLTLQQGFDTYEGTTDTYLHDTKPAKNYGNATALYQSGARYTVLLRFAIFQSEGGPVPDGATILSATLDMHKDKYDFVYRLHAMRAGWDELKATWELATEGQPWSVAGANGAGTDYDTLWDAEYAATADSTLMRFDVTPRVQVWSDGDDNHGWRIVGVSGTDRLRTLRSSEYSNNTALRPALTIKYLAAPVP